MLAYAGPVTVAFQGSLLDQSEDISLRELSSCVRRTPLARGGWLDLVPGWVTGADALFERLTAAVRWRAERRPMYDRGLAS